MSASGSIAFSSDGLLHQQQPRAAIARTRQPRPGARVAARDAGRSYRADAHPRPRIGADPSHITTDYSEALTELVTPTFPTTSHWSTTCATCISSSIALARNCSGPPPCRARFATTMRFRSHATVHRTRAG